MLRQYTKDWTLSEGLLIKAGDDNLSVEFLN